MGLFGRSSNNQETSEPLEIPNLEPSEEAGERRRPLDELLADTPAQTDDVWHLPDLDDDVAAADRFDAELAAFDSTALDSTALDGTAVTEPVDGATPAPLFEDLPDLVPTEATETPAEPVGFESTAMRSTPVSGPTAYDVPDILVDLGCDEQSDWATIEASARRRAADPDPEVRREANKAYAALRLLQV